MRSFKPIRFNLQFRNNDKLIPIRSLKDLTENMNVNDLFDYFSSGQLERWMEVRDEWKKAEEIKKLRTGKGNEDEKLKELFKILNLGFTENDINYAITSYIYPQKMLKKRENETKLKKDITELVKKDFENYAGLVKSIPPFFKDECYNEDFWIQTRCAVKTILESFPEQFKLDFIRFYEIMCGWNPFAILAVMMDEDWRKYYIADELSSYLLLTLGRLDSMYEPSESMTTMKEHSSFYTRTKSFIRVERINSNSSIRMTFDDKKSFEMKDNKLSFIHEVNYVRAPGDWADEVDNKKVMIIWCSGSIDIRPHLNKDAEQPASNVQPFAIMDGLDFRVRTQGSSNAILLYKEI